MACKPLSSSMAANNTEERLFGSTGVIPIKEARAFMEDALDEYEFVSFRNLPDKGHGPMAVIKYSFFPMTAEHQYES